MSFARLRATWILEDVPTDVEFEQLDLNQSRALDGHSGGSYAPSSEIELDESSLLTPASVLKVTGDFECTTSANVGGTGTVGTLVTCGDLETTTNLFIEGGLEVGGVSTFQGSVLISSAALSTDDDVTIATNTSENFTLTGSHDGAVTVSAPSTWYDRMTLQGDAQVAWRQVTGAAYSRTYSVEDADEILAPTSVSATCIYTLKNDSAVAGSRIRFSRVAIDADDPTAEADLSSGVSVSANPGTANAILRTLLDTSGNYRFLEFMFDGTAWFILRQEKNP